MLFAKITLFGGMSSYGCVIMWNVTRKKHKIVNFFDTSAFPAPFG